MSVCMSVSVFSVSVCVYSVCVVFSMDGAKQIQDSSLIIHSFCM